MHDHLPTLLVLAASHYQLPFIRAARSAGCRVLTADNRPENPGHRLADECFNIDTTDIAALLTLARTHAIAGVVAAASDVALDAAAAIGAARGITAPSAECVAILTRRSAFRELQAAMRLPAPHHVVSRVAVDFAPPWIVKPNRASGAKGIRIVEQREGLEEAWQSATLQSNDGKAVVEACLRGHHGTVEGVMANGTIAAALFTDRLTVEPPWVATRGHRVPSVVAVTAQQSATRQIEAIFDRLGYRNGPFDCDFLVDDKAMPILIELSPRAGGNTLTRLLEISVGFDMPKYVVELALGCPQPPTPFPRPCHAAVEILGVDRGGRLAYDQCQIAALVAHPGILGIEFDVPPGTPVRAFTNGRHRVGELLASARTPEELDKLVSRSLDSLALRVRP